MDVKLVLFKSNGQRKDFPIINPSTVIGRGEDCDLQVPLLNVSRRHCQVNIAGNSIKVKDLASSNGTYVNNHRVQEGDVQAGDRIAVGPIVFTVQIDGQPEEIKPVITKGQKMAEQAAAGGGEAEAVELEADVVAQPGASALRTEKPAQAPGKAARPAKPAPKAPAKDVSKAKTVEDVDVDPIAALEALAAEDDDEPKTKAK